MRNAIRQSLPKTCSGKIMRRLPKFRKPGRSRLAGQRGRLI